MPETAVRTKKIVVTLVGDPDDTLYEVDAEAGSTPESVFEAMGLAKDANGQFPYQLSKPGAGVFRDNENVFAAVKDGDKVKAVPKSPVAIG